MGRLKYLSVPETRFRPSRTEVRVYEVEMLAAHEAAAWVRFHRKWDDDKEQFVPVHIRSYHTVVAADLRDEPFPNAEASLTVQ